MQDSFGILLGVLKIIFMNLFMHVINLLSSIGLVGDTLTFNKKIVGLIFDTGRATLDF